MMRKIHKGMWDGLPATAVARLMGCSDTLARAKLKSKQILLDRPLTLEDIGEVVFDYKSYRRDQSVDRLLNRWKLSV